MRTGPTLNAVPSAMPPTVTFSPPQRSPWHSPMPYLFGGLAAMLGLIAFALLILACSFYRRLSERPQNVDVDVEAGGEKSGGDSGEPLPEFEEKIVVIMAGDVNPTFLATPVSSPKGCNPFGDLKALIKREGEEREKTDDLDHDEKPKEEMGRHEPTRLENPDSQQQNQ